MHTFSDYPHPDLWAGSETLNIDGVTWGGAKATQSVGHVPYYEDIFYRGCIALMPVTEFLALAKPLESPNESSLAYQMDTIEKERPMAPPFFRFARNEEGQWEIVGHEGRHRCLAIALKEPRALIPVALIPEGEIRARHLNEDTFAEWTSGLGVVPESPDEPIGPMGIHLIYHETVGMWPGPNMDRHYRPPVPDCYDEMLADLSHRLLDQGRKPDRNEHDMEMPGC